MADAKLCEQGVYGADLHAGTSATVAQLGGVDMVLPTWNKQRQGANSLLNFERFS